MCVAQLSLARLRVKTRIRWSEGVSFVAETGSGHALVLDGSPEAGGRNLGPRRMELVLAGKPVGEPQMPSLGCGIKWKPGNAPS